MTIALQTIRLDQPAPVELFELDLTRMGVPLTRFSPQANELDAGVAWQGHLYNLFPIQAEGFEQRSTGVFPRPRLSCSNVLGTLGPLVREYGNLRGAKVIRRRTMACYLDAANFADGNPGANPDAEWHPEVWLIDRCIARSRLAAQWELCNPLDFAGVMLPGRTVQPDYCPVRYRGSDCGYTGPAVAKLDDSPTSNLAEDRCSKRLTGCRLRFGTAPLPFGGFPGVGHPPLFRRFRDRRAGHQLHRRRWPERGRQAGTDHLQLAPPHRSRHRSAVLTSWTRRNAQFPCTPNS